MEILVRKKCDQAGVEQFTSLVDTAVYTRLASSAHNVCTYVCIYQYVS